MPGKSSPSSPHAGDVRPFDFTVGLNLPSRVGGSTEHATLVQLPWDPARSAYMLTAAGLAILAARLASHPPFLAWPAWFVRQAESLPLMRPPNSPASWQFHLVCLMANCPDLLLRRSDLQTLKEAMFRSMSQHAHPEWFPSLSEDSDVIQHVNKCGQWGLELQSGKLTSPSGEQVTFYLLPSPLRFDHHCRTPRPEGYRMQPELPACGCTPASDASAQVAGERPGAATREFLRRNYLDPQLEWSANAHRDPFNKDLGTVAQPKHMNRKLRDAVKLDEYGLPMAPTVPHLSRSLEEFYPAEWEREQLAEAALTSLPPKVRAALLRRISS